MNAIELVPASALRPALYNPREADEERLALVRLSLQKLGFLLPLVATPDGEILSGHQRHAVAVAMGAMGLIARQYIPKGGKVYDLGASTGNVGRVLAPVLEARGATLTALDECPDIQRPLYPGELGEDAVEVFRFGDFVGWIIEG